MQTIGTFDAKTHLSALLDRVAAGETITITRHGVAAAMLVPVGDAARKSSHAQVIEGMRALRQRVKADTLSVRDMIRQGRRF